MRQEVACLLVSSVAVIRLVRRPLLIAQMIALRSADVFEQVRLNAVKFAQLLDFTEIWMG